MTLSIAAVVATCNRPQLLANRSLPSVALQTRPPDYLVVVDDSDRRVRRTNREIVADFRADGTKAMYLENYRTPGAAGAWNTALSELQDVIPSAFIAILDDDDRWDPTYLGSCEEAASADNLDMVVAGIVRYEFMEDDGRPLWIPNRLDVNDLLVQNPHVQGSNLFLRLRTLLEAGGFDEALPSTTDRDLCIRLADLGTVRYGAIAKHLVHHYAEAHRPRLSTPGENAKCEGLRRFFRKYRSRMSPEQRIAFLERSRNRFGCDVEEADPTPARTGPFAAHAPNVQGRLDLVVGAITSPEVSNAANLMDMLLRKINCRSDTTLKVVLLENGGWDNTSRDNLRAAVHKASRLGLDVDVKTLEQQEQDTAKGSFTATPEQLSTRKSIALSRTMLQHYLFLEAKPIAGAVVWILDDDAALEGLEYGQDNAIRPREVDYVSEIKRLKNTGNCVVIGEVTGEPPLPALSCIRTQLVDLYHNLAQLAALRPDTPYPDRSDENRAVRMSRRDYYYDLSRIETDHLESPFWYEAGSKSPTAADALRAIVSRLPDVLGGGQVFRPLVQTSRADPVSGLVPSVNRGPTTLVFDLQALREFPNAVPAFDGSDTRRSDMVWSLLNRFIGGCKVVQAPLPIRQDRTAIAHSEPDFKTLVQDIRGYAFYSSLHDIFLEKTQQGQREGRSPYSRSLLDFDADDIRQATQLYVKYIRERSRSFELSFLRIVGLVSTLRRFYESSSDTGPTPWWLASPEYDAPVVALRGFVEKLASIYTQARLEEFKRLVSDSHAGPMAEYLKAMPDIVARHSANTPLPTEALQRAAENHVRKEFGTGRLTCLGIGAEGVVLTDGRLVYKYFHYWKARNKDRQVAFLRSLAGKLSPYPTLPDIREVRDNGDCVVAVYPYDAGTKYTGGRLDDMLTLLRECREAGITCRNVHPDNLLVAQSGLKLIDIGSDIAPINDADFEQMCRRAFLSYSLHFRRDLKQLMTKALSDPDLPELTGLRQFKHALDPRGPDELLHRPMAQLILSQKPKAVLDYGCGDGRLAEQLCEHVSVVAGYDPDAAEIEECLAAWQPRRVRRPRVVGKAGGKLNPVRCRSL